MGRLSKDGKECSNAEHSQIYHSLRMDVWQVDKLFDEPPERQADGHEEGLPTVSVD